MAVPELDELAKVLPERAPDGRFYWQPFVDRIEKRFDGLPAPDGGESFVQGCVAAGCKAVAGNPAQHVVGTPGAAPVGSAGARRFRAAHPPGTVLCRQSALRGARGLPVADQD